MLLRGHLVLVLGPFLVWTWWQGLCCLLFSCGYKIFLLLFFWVGGLLIAVVTEEDTRRKKDREGYRAGQESTDGIGFVKGKEPAEPVPPNLPPNECHFRKASLMFPH